MGQQQSTLTDQRSFRRTVVVAFAWLFTALAMLALLSAPDATSDEMFHAVNIWCGQGERPPYCEGIRFDVPYPGAQVNFDFLTCQKDVTRPLVCPSGQLGTSFRSINHGNLYPTLFYSALSWFVIPSFEGSVMLLRVMNAFVITFLLALTILLLPHRYRIVVALIMLTVFPSTGYYLFASINPSSWTAFGVAFSWLPFHAALSSHNLNKRRRYTLLIISLLISTMAAGSRWDGIPFLLLAMSCAVIHVVLNRYTQKRTLIVAITIFGLGVLLLLYELTAPVHVQPSRFLKLMTKYSIGEPDNLSFFSHYLLDGVPNALGALGTLPTGSGLRLPRIVMIVNVTVLVGFIYVTRQLASRAQILGTFSALFIMSAVIAAQVALIDDRDPFGVEPRYSFPLLLFAVGWWFFTGPADLQGIAIKHLRVAISIALFMFALVVFTVGERFVDTQTFGLRFIPEGPDQWWWSWVPVGPNVVVLVAVLAMWQFLRRFPTLLAGPGTPL